MYKNSKILALIPARGGSKGIKDKNIKKLCGLPLIAYSINVAKNSKFVDSVVVTTDSEKIAEISRSYGAEVPFLRPSFLASDKAKTIDAVIHALGSLKNKYDVLVLLQPTQPLRTVDDLDGAIRLFFEKEERSLVSVSETFNHPILLRTLDDDGVVSKLLNQNSTVRRQDLPDYYVVNGAIYINKIGDITDKTSFNDNEIGYLMQKEHSVDIDDILDFYFAETILKNAVFARRR